MFNGCLYFYVNFEKTYPLLAYFSKTVNSIIYSQRTWTFDFQNLSAQISQQHGAVRACQNPEISESEFRLIA